MSDHDPQSQPGGRSQSAADPADEQALAAVYHGGEPEQPPTALDRRIAAAAAAASARRARRRRLTRAGGGLATAAVVVLAVTLVLDQPSDPALEFEPAPAAPSAPARLAPAESAAPADRSGDDEEAEPAARARTPVADVRRELGAPATAPPVTYTEPGCATPFEVPPGATLRPLPEGLEIAVDGETFLLRCVDGAWARQAGVPDDAN